jgi:hypothetical protein
MMILMKIDLIQGFFVVKTVAIDAGIEDTLWKRSMHSVAMCF